MRRYLVDTTPLVALLRRRPAVVTLLTPWLSARELATSIVVYGEAVEAVTRLPDFASRRVTLRALLRSVHPYALAYPIMERYADLRQQLRPPRGPGLIGDIDTLIAATALTRDLTLITTDTDFVRVPGRKLLLLDCATFTRRTT